MPLKTRLDAEMYLDDVDGNRALRSGFKRIGNYNWGKCNALVNKCRKTEDIGFHRKAIAKYLSYLKLRNVLWVFLFHPIYWRYLHGFKSPDWMREILTIALSEDNRDATDFFASWSLIQTNHLLTETTSKLVTTMTTDQKQDSEVDTTL